jgi:hypothetical protein
MIPISSFCPGNRTLKVGLALWRVVPLLEQLRESLKAVLRGYRN